MTQGELFFVESKPKFPTTRYQGSKLKYLDWIWHSIEDLNFDTALDAFAGTGSVSYLLKEKGKSVTCNDILKFNQIIGKALIENSDTRLEPSDIELILTKKTDFEYPNFIATTFKDTYYTDKENEWLDIVITNISTIKCPYKKALAQFALFQSCIIKRPYNLFHRKNLYIRTQDVPRSFGNKTTWDTEFEVHFRNFVKEANQAVFSNNKKNLSTNYDAINIKDKYDLIYVDTPYISSQGVGVDYYDFYHFLEGIVNYDTWNEKIDYKSKNKKLIKSESGWTSRNDIAKSFDELFYKFKNSILVISYRSDGIPSIEEIKTLLYKYKNNVQIVRSNSMKYALSTKQSQEVLLIAK